MLANEAHNRPGAERDLADPPARRGPSATATERGYAPPRRHLAALGGSLAVHALIIFALVATASRVGHLRDDFIVAYLIDPGGHIGSASSGKNATGPKFDLEPLSPPAAAVPMPRAPILVRSHREAKRSDPRSADPSEISPDSSRVSAAVADRFLPPSSPKGAAGAQIAPTGGTGTGGAATLRREGSAGSGSTGDGVGSGAAIVARADYDADPAPPYPIRARRRGEEGTVTLRILVAQNGSVLRAELLTSSGYPELDSAALETVRSRWRFVPARRDGQAVQSWVIVPIRFTLAADSN